MCNNKDSAPINLVIGSGFDYRNFSRGIFLPNPLSHSSCQQSCFLTIQSILRFQAPLNHAANPTNLP